MKLTKQLEKEVRQVIDAYWDNYIKGDVKAMAPLLDDDYTQVGSAESEVFVNKEDAVKFLYETIDQVAGKVEMRNRMSKVEPFEEFILISDLCDLYVLNENEWIFYAKFRASSLLQKKEGGWKIVHQHSSFPDARTEEGGNIAIEEIAQENLELREAVKRRTVELEHKNRELEIESSLERVRAVAMSMRKSDDLLNVCESVFTELRLLGFTEVDLRNTQIVINNDDKKFYQGYQYSDYNGGEIAEVPYDLHPVTRMLHDKLTQSKDAFADIEISGKTLDEWKAFVNTFPQKPDSKLNNAAELHYYFYSVGTGALGISSFITLPEEKLNILKRLRNVFNLSYQRYTDIALAEAQARESQIELALERVRGRTMAMHDSQELAETAVLLFQQFEALVGLSAQARTYIAVIDADTDSAVVWMTLPDGQMRPGSHRTPLTEHTSLRKVYNAWKRQKPIHVRDLKGKAVADYAAYVATLPHAQEDEGLRRMADSPPQRLVISEATFSHGLIGVMTDAPLAEETLALLTRFARVFEQTYRRFLDLQQAEAQAREAQIEAAVERVRAKALAMYKSEEILQVVAGLKDEVMNLNIPGVVAATIYLKEKDDRIRMWDLSSVVEMKEGFHLPLDIVFRLEETDPNFFVRRIWNNTEKYFVVMQDEADLARTVKWLRQYKKEEAENVQRFIEANELKQLFHPTIQLTNGRLCVDLLDTPPEEIESILSKMGAAFDLAYKRFQDLQKAEAQSREAQIELGLERVRARTIAMQKSEELKEVIQVVYEQFVQLNIFIEHTGFIIDYKARDDMNIWLADQNGAPSQVTIPYFDSPHWNSFNKAKEKGLDFFATNLTFEEKNSFYQKLFKYIPGLPEEAKEFYFSCPGLAISTVLLENVGLYIENFSGIPYSDEENNTLMRFGKVFQQTYTRFLDLKQAEEQAREAQIEAALERVRAKAMAMHNSDDISDATAIVFSELEKLEIVTLRCGIVIIHETKHMDVWTATSTTEETDVRVIGRLDMTIHPLLEGVFKAWKEQQPFYSYELAGKDMQKYYKALELAPDYPIPEQGKRSVRQVCGTFNFPEGALFVFAEHPLTGETIQIFKRFASVFALTYRRYLDLKQAEAQAREAQIEAALERVRSRTMAMQKSEELADTAAIVFKQLSDLGMAPNRLYIIIIKDETGDLEAWITDEDGKKVSQTFKGNIDQTPVFYEMFEGWKAQKQSLIIDLQGKKLTDYIRFLSAQLQVPVTTGHTQKRRIQSVAYFSKGLIGMASPEPLPEENMRLLERFAKVFDLTYTRFNDLQKAEAQARQAVQQATLDRVRAEIASMRSAGDLQRITPLIWRELTTLRVPFFRCGVFIIDEASEQAQVYLSTPSGESLAALPLKFDSTPLIEQTVQHWRQQKVYREEWGRQQFIEWTQSLIEQGLIDNPRKYQAGEEPPETLALQFVPFTQGMLYVGSASPLSGDEIDVTKTLADAFAVAYARYEDFQRLEAAKAEVEAAFRELGLLSKELEAKNAALETENQRKARELEEARRLQLAMLPKTIPTLPHLDIAVYMQTATEVGGDYYDFKLGSDGTLTAAIGDATGHGLQAGTMVATAKGLFNSLAHEPDLVQILQKSSTAIKAMGFQRLYMAMMIAKFTGDHMQIASAGMPFALIHRAQSGKVEEVALKGMPLGSFPDFPYRQKELALHPGDTVLLLSDGLEEMFNEQGETLGAEQVKTLFAEVGHESPQQIIGQLKLAGAAWAGERVAQDDVTMVVVKVK
jgi:serine phosphatase RsbU (regulator of sigma subunit)/ketosteroid isomerase-like protein